ncbi:MAG: hypothetical protein FWB99_09255 [Treponema sp.]|nr:hypothetical protein [Treponema sp.]
MHEKRINNEKDNDGDGSMNASHTNLTIIGLGGQQTITFTGAGLPFTVGATSSVPTISLTLRNIAIEGGAGNNTMMIVRNAARLYVESGSAIRGTSNNSTSETTGWGPRLPYLPAAFLT